MKLLDEFLIAFELRMQNLHGDRAIEQLAADSEFSQVDDPRYVGIDGEVPLTESLKLVIDRLLPYW